MPVSKFSTAGMQGDKLIVSLGFQLNGTDREPSTPQPTEPLDRFAFCCCVVVNAYGLQICGEDTVLEPWPGHVLEWDKLSQEGCRNLR